MLRFSESFTDNEEVDAFLRKFINDAIEEEVLFAIKAYEENAEIEREEFNPTWNCDTVLLHLFPKNWPDVDGSSKGQLRIMKGLYSLLHSDKEFVPTLIMEYVMAKVIDMAIFDSDCALEDIPLKTLIDEIENGTCKNRPYESLLEERDISCGVPFTRETYNKIYNAYYEKYRSEDYQDIYNEEEAKEAAEEKVNSLWKFSPEWYDFCFWDSDYLMLDMLSMGQLRLSTMNEYLGAVSDDAGYDAFYLPKNWKNSKGFRFLSKEREEEYKYGKD